MCRNFISYSLGPAPYKKSRLRYTVVLSMYNEIYKQHLTFTSFALHCASVLTRGKGQGYDERRNKTRLKLKCISIFAEQRNFTKFVVFDKISRYFMNFHFRENCPNISIIAKINELFVFAKIFSVFLPKYHILLRCRAPLLLFYTYFLEHFSEKKCFCANAKRKFSFYLNKTYLTILALLFEDSLWNKALPAQGNYPLIPNILR